MQNELDVIVVGATGIDTNIYLPGKDIDFSVEANFTENIDYVGQAGGYVSRGFAQLGYRTGLIDFIGADHNGYFIKKELEKDGIELLLFIDPKGTRRSINLMYSDGRRKNFYEGKSHIKLEPNIEKCRSFIKRARLIHFNLMNWSRKLLSIAKELGKIISCDLQDIVNVHDPYRQDFIEYADILFFSSVNYDNPTPAMRYFQKRKPGIILVAGMGAKGSALGYDDKIIFYPPSEVIKDPIIDTNGAGDGLAVGFLSSYFFEGYSENESIERGQIVARYTCTIKASSSRLISKSQLDMYHNLI